MMKNEFLFCKIVNGEIPANIAYEEELLLAFDDIDPKAPIHKLIIPKQHIATLNDTTDKHKALLGHMIHTATILAKGLGIAESGYRTVMNCNQDGGQTVFHIHLHLLGQRQLTWPPG